MDTGRTTSGILRALEPCETYEIMQLLLLRETAADWNREQYWTLALDTENRIIQLERICIGSLESERLNTARILAGALHKNADGILLLHFRPDAEFTPDEESIQRAEKLLYTGELLGLPIRDYILITGKSYYSFAYNRLLQDLQQNAREALQLPAQKIRQQKVSAEQARAIGESKRTRDIARNMKKSGADAGYIMEMTGLSRATIAHLKTGEETQ